MCLKCSEVGFIFSRDGAVHVSLTCVVLCVAAGVHQPLLQRHHLHAEGGGAVLQRRVLRKLPGKKNRNPSNCDFCRLLATTGLLPPSGGHVGYYLCLTLKLLTENETWIRFQAADV